MNIKKIEISNFRKIKKIEFDFSERTNLIYGNNAVGKTTILEAIFLLGFGKSFKEKSHKKLIKYGESYFHISSSVFNLLGNFTISSFYQKKIFSLIIDKKKAKLKMFKKFFVLFFF